MPELTIVQQIAIWIIPVLFAITFHEAAHAWTSYHLGDTTAKALGRLSFNPIKHIDPIGTVLVPLLVLVLSNFNFVFGWAKPVPINPSQFKNPRRDIAIATAAGPLSNLGMAFIWAALLKLGMLSNPQTSMLALFVVLSARAGVIINLVLAFLNLIPVPPLDGSKIVGNLLPVHQAVKYEKIEPYGFLILLVMMVTGVLNWLIGPPVNWSMSALSSLFNV